ncbi:common plant regulatory factor 1-like isoform X1 [Typha latifolia]|uniref:common plant regulatory factor 1-like isoform X1 n=1 Tax=Typha latifolia TaxID=4733 RepID=UPI003C2CDE5B
MGNDEAATPPKSDKSSSPVQDQPAVYPYPDWSAIQAYYGPGVLPPPYFSTAVAPGHTPHPYVWGPQPMLPPFGSPYAAIYPHGGVYSHPSVPFASQMQYQGISPSPTTDEAVAAANPLSTEFPGKSASNKDKGPSKKHKSDGLAMSIGNGNTESTPSGDVTGRSESGYNSAEGSSDGSGGSNDAGGNKTQANGSLEGNPMSDESKFDKQANAAQGGETNGSSKLPLGVTVAPANIVGKPLGSVPSCNSAPGMDFSVASISKAKAIGTPIPPSTNGIMPGRNGVPAELWGKDERELKREKRKQSNRESARRSRLRKQAETEELATKVEALKAENTTLRSEISRLTENAEKIRLENSALMEKLKNAQSSQPEEMPLPNNIETDGNSTVVVENFLSIIDKPNTSSRSEQVDSQEPGNSGTKLHQLLNSSPRTDAVAAS